MSAYLRTIVVAPMTTGSRSAGYRIALTFDGKQGFVLLDRLRTLDKTLDATLTALRDMFAP